jgi:uncharacterized protein YigE (DUF2233 family)
MLQAQTLLPGLELLELEMSQKSIVGDSVLRVVRADLSKFQLVLLNKSKPEEGKHLSMRGWAKKHSLVTAINASMYRKDYSTSLSYMVDGQHINNGTLSKDRSILAFNGEGQVKLIDRECDRFDKEKANYTTFVQSIRMISCQGRNVWSQSKKIYSQAAIGIDRSGRLLLIHSRSPYSTHDFINQLKRLPLDLSRAMYVEGGPPAQLYVNTPVLERAWVGSYSSGKSEHNKNHLEVPVPNVLGLKPR